MGVGASIYFFGFLVSKQDGKIAIFISTFIMRIHYGTS